MYALKGCGLGMLDEVEGTEDRGIGGPPDGSTPQIVTSRQTRAQPPRRDREALGLDQLGGSRDRRQSHRPVAGVAAVEPHFGAVTAHDNSVAVVFDFVNPVGARRRRWSFNRAGMTNPRGRRLIFIARRR
jgi:hypothetical protein